MYYNWIVIDADEGLPTMVHAKLVAVTSHSESIANPELAAVELGIANST